jgi:hypothetical protein
LLGSTWFDDGVHHVNDRKSAHAHAPHCMLDSSLHASIIIVLPGCLPPASVCLDTHWVP